MRYVLDKNEIKEIERYMKLAAEEAKKSTCKKSQRGVVIVKNGEVIGKVWTRKSFFVEKEL